MSFSALFVAVVLLAGGCHWVARASVDRDGGDSNGFDQGPSLSDDGRYVAFDSGASDLVAGDGNGVQDAFVRDLRTGTTTRVSVDAAGGDADGTSLSPSISGEGHHVAFESSARDLVPGADGPYQKVFVRDLRTGTTRLVSGAADGSDPTSGSSGASISDDGRYVAFASRSTNLVPGGNAPGNVFVRDLLSGAITQVSVDTTGGDPDGDSGAPSISDDGRYVAFTSEATDLLPGDTNGHSDVFVRDLATGTTIWGSIDHTLAGVVPTVTNGAAISGDGDHLAFVSTDVDSSGEFVYGYVYLHDLVQGTTTLVSGTAPGAAGDGSAGSASVSDDGRYVAFTSWMAGLVPGDRNERSDVFVHDGQTGITTRRSVDAFDREGNAASGDSTISGEGRYVAFTSAATNLVPGDGTGGHAGTDLFVAAATTPTVASVTPSVVPRGTSSNLTITGRGFGPGTEVVPSPFGPGGLTFGEPTVVSETEIRVTVHAASSAPTGPSTFLVSEPGTGPGPGATAWGSCGGCLVVT